MSFYTRFNYSALSARSLSYRPVSRPATPQPYTTNARTAIPFARQQAPAQRPGQSYLSYFASHNLYTSRGIDPGGHATRIAGGGGLTATQATQARQATQATQARQYQQPAFRAFTYNPFGRRP